MGFFSILGIPTLVFLSIINLDIFGGDLTWGLVQPAGNPGILEVWLGSNIKLSQLSESESIVYS